MLVGEMSARAFHVHSVRRLRDLRHLVEQFEDALKRCERVRQHEVHIGKHLDRLI